MSKRHNSDSDLANKIRTTLDQSVDDLDQDTLRALRVARHDAVEQLRKPKRHWIPLTSVAATASVAILAVSLITLHPADNGMLQEVDDMSLLTAGDDLELYENLEFYQWLAFEERTS